MGVKADRAYVRARMVEVCELTGECLSNLVILTHPSCYKPFLSRLADVIVSSTIEGEQIMILSKGNASAAMGYSSYG